MDVHINSDEGAHMAKLEDKLLKCKVIMVAYCHLKRFPIVSDHDNYWQYILVTVCLIDS